MALSGGTALRAYTAHNLLEEACSRAGIPPEGISGEIVEKFLDQLNLFTTAILNSGIQLWRRQQFILPCYINSNQIPLPTTCNTVVTLNRRSMFRQTTGAAFSDAGGTAALAFDDNFSTVCTQTSANGSIGMQFTSQTIVTSVGILSGGAWTGGLFFEYSQDGTNYFSLDAADVSFVDAGVWVWYDLDATPNGGALYWRVRSVGDTPFSATEIFFGNTPMEINLGPWNLDDFANMPNKTQGGSVVNWYQQRNLSTPLLLVWPTPNYGARYDTLVLWSTQYLEQVTQITQALDFPPRWFEAVTAEMARRLCRSLKEADLKRYPMLVEEAKEAMWLAQSEERDPAPTNYDLGLQYYTSG